MVKAYEYWCEEEESIDEVLSELQEISTAIISQPWFDSDLQKINRFFREIAKADGVVLDSEKFTSLTSLVYEEKPHL